MSQGDSLGDRMKGYEGASRHVLPAKMPVIVRVDGRAFHTYTRGSERPFDSGLMEAMNKVAIRLCEEMANAVLAYVQSDEISVLLVDYKNPDTQPWFGGVLQKMCSIAASTAAVTMTLESPKWHPRCLDTMMAYGPQGCDFDARAFVLPREEVCNYFIWRQQDWTRNSIQMLARSLYSHKELDGKDQAAMHEMCFQKGENWAHLSNELKNGRCIVRKPEAFDIPAGPNKGQVITRHRWAVDHEMPILTRDRGYIEGLL
jgi:tRNA(His) 5'-end guanylyltransferase